MNHHSRNNNDYNNIHPFEQKNNQEPDNSNNYQQEIYNISVKINPKRRIECKQK